MSSNIPDDIKDLKIPLPPPNIQEEIVGICEAIDAEAEKAEKEIEKGRKEIADKIAVLIATIALRLTK